jgi:pimeloyl-ACP methyl ester carboxylesterase
MDDAPLPPPTDVGYDEFSYLPDNAAEAGLPFDPERPPAVRRVTVPVPSGHTVSALVWGDGPPELVLLHGGAQNAHTWDTTVLALGRPLVALDLPGHGHSSWRDDHDYNPTSVAADVAHAAQALAPGAGTLVGMSLGGLTSIAVLAAHPQVARRLLLVDVTPGVNREKASAIVAFVAGPAVFESFDAIVDRTVAHNPTRSRSSLERGVRHNARPNADGTWSWRYDRPTERRLRGVGDRGSLWDDLARLDHPVLLARGSSSPVVGDEDVERLGQLRPDAEVVVVDGAGHSIQGDRPVELAALVERFHTAAAGQG